MQWIVCGKYECLQPGITGKEEGIVCQAVRCGDDNLVLPSNSREGCENSLLLETTCGTISSIIPSASFSKCSHWLCP